MKRFVLFALAIPSALLAGKADPGAPLIAADEAFSAASEREGSHTAFARMALPDSETFAPRRIKVLELGKGQPEPPVMYTWKPEHAWIACDGTAGVTYGRWAIKSTTRTFTVDPAFRNGSYEAVWVKMKNGDYRVLLRRGGTEKRLLRSKPGRKGMRAACGGPKPSLPITAPDVGTDYKLGASNDQTLVWTSAVSSAGEVRIVISLWNGQAFAPVLEDVAPPRVAR